MTDAVEKLLQCWQILIQNLQDRRFLQMLGERTVMQEALFYSFGLEGHVSTDHLLRFIDRFVDPGDLRKNLHPVTARWVGP